MLQHYSKINANLCYSFSTGFVGHNWLEYPQSGLGGTKLKKGAHIPFPNSNAQTFKLMARPFQKARK